MALGGLLVGSLTLRATARVPLPMLHSVPGLHLADGVGEGREAFTSMGEWFPGNLKRKENFLF